MRINTNVSSLTAQESAINTNANIKGSLEKLSSGLRINKASDDASGLAIADKLRTQATSIKQGISNGNSAVTLLQIADKSMAEQSSILDTVKAKLIQANTDTTSSAGREAIRQDINKLLEQLDNIAQQTNYNGTSLLQAGAVDTGSMTGLSFQVGETASDTISVGTIQSNTVGLKNILADVSTNYGGVGGNITIDGNYSGTVSGTYGSITINGDFTGTLSGTYGNVIVNGSASGSMSGTKGNITINGDFSGSISDTSGNIIIEGANSGSIGGTYGLVTVNNNIFGDLVDLKNLGQNSLTKSHSNTYQTVVDTAITKLNEYRSEIGSTQNQVQSAVRNLMTQATNVEAAESIIRDVDYATESSNFNRQNIISQAGSYAISQSNAMSQSVLRLLQ